MNTLWRKIRFFVIIGIFNVIIDIGVFNLILYMFGLPHGWSYPLYRSISFSVACVNSYMMNATLTFKASSKNIRSFGYFLLVTGCGMVLNVWISTVLFSRFQKFPIGQLLQANGALLVGIGVSMVWNFIFYNYVIFRQKQ